MFWIIFLGISFIGGLITSFSFENGVRILLLDVVVGLFLTHFFLISAKRTDAVKKYLIVFGPFVVVAVLSLFSATLFLKSSEIGPASLHLVRFIIFSMLAVLVPFYESFKKRALLLLWGSGVGVALLGILQYFLYPNLRNLSYLGWDPHQYRIFSTLFDPNFVGIIVVLTFILHGYILTELPEWAKRVGFTAIVIALPLTYSRGSWIAWFVGLFVRAIYRKEIVQIVMWAIAAAILLPFLPQPGGEGVNLLRTISIESRIANSRDAINIFLSSPLLGVGFNTLGDMNIHNSWLFILATTGILGFVSFGWIWWNALGGDDDKTSSHPLKELLFISFVAVGVHSLFDNSLFYPHVMLWMWVLIGYIIARNEMTRQTS